MEKERKLLKEFGLVALCWQCDQPIDSEGGWTDTLMKCQKCKKFLVHIVSLEKYDEIRYEKEKKEKEKRAEEEARERINWRTPWRL